MDEIDIPDDDAPLAVPNREHTNATGRGTYQGAEMGRTCHRPGAYDAYDLPSVFGTQRVLPRGAK